MGWKASMIIIQNTSNIRDDATILNALGLKNYQAAGQTTLDQSLYPRDGSYSIGYYKDTVIICDDTQLLFDFTNPFEVTQAEEKLPELFPGAEILAVGCNSVDNMHTYHLLRDGASIRAKAISADFPVLEEGTPFEEEAALYARSEMHNGERVWKYDWAPGENFHENQLMEEFTFGVAKRLLGLRLDQPEGDELLFNTPFNRYLRA